MRPEPAQFRGWFVLIDLLLIRAIFSASPFTHEIP